MAGIDIYQPCPGGCGKKIKFCCSKDICQDLERLQRMITGEQIQAAWDKTLQLMQQHPGRSCLLATQVELAIAKHDPQLIHQSVDAFSAQAPHNPLAISYRALITLSQGVAETLRSLDNAFREPLSEMPERFVVNLLKTASIFHEMHAFLPALALARLTFRYSPDEFAFRHDLLMAIERNPTISLVERFHWELDPIPEKVTWRTEMEAVYEQIRRGAWWSAADYLQQMSLRVLDQPVLLKALGLCLAWCDRRLEASIVFRKYAELRQLTESQALWGELMAQQLMPHSNVPTYDIIQRTYEVCDMEGLLDALRLNPAMLARSSSELHEFEAVDGVAPRQAFAALDRPLDRTVTEPTAEQVAHVRGALMVFGRETDRPARLVFRWVRDLQGDVNLQAVVDQLARYLQGEPVEEKLGIVPIFEHEIRIFPVLPPATNALRKRELLRMTREQRFWEKWKTTPQPALGNRSPLELLQEGKAGIRAVAASLKASELESVASLHTDFAAIRESLGMPAETTFAPTSEEQQFLTPVDYTRLQLDTLTDDALATCFVAARHFRLLAPLRRFAEELLRRDAAQKPSSVLDWQDVYASMANTTQDLDESLQWVNKARQRAVAEGLSPAQWLVLELSLRFERGESAEAERVLLEIQRRHMREPGVEQMVRQLMMSLQSNMSDEGDAAELGTPETVETSAGIWTPDSGEPVVGPAPGGSGGKLWLPGTE